jgi:predicted histidine transporter YuiF (NhaC family)
MALTKLTCGIFISTVPLLRSADIISSLHVPFQTDCSFGCLQEPTCVGFKYKLGVSSSPSINCQLSNTNGKNNTADDDKGWVYFIDIKARLVRDILEI